MPLTSAVGTNTAVSTTAIEVPASPTSSHALLVASFRSRPCSTHRCTFSTTTIASSTTMPIANTSPNNESELRENPIRAITAKVPINETGIDFGLWLSDCGGVGGGALGGDYPRLRVSLPPSFLGEGNFADPPRSEGKPFRGERRDAVAAGVFFRGGDC